MQGKKGSGTRGGGRGRRAPLARAESLLLRPSLVGNLLCSDLGRATVILRLYHHLHKIWEEVLSPFLYPCCVGNLRESLWWRRDGMSCRRHRYETKESSSRGLLQWEKVIEMAMAPGTTSVGRRELTS